MPERGKQVQLPTAARLLLRGLGYFTWPLRIDDYLELISPLWSVEELPRPDRASTSRDRRRGHRLHHPRIPMAGHQPGQYVRIGFDVAGKRQWRAYSLSSDAARPGRAGDDHRQTH